jgi:hypothetical protein
MSDVRAYPSQGDAALSRAAGRVETVFDVVAIVVGIGTALVFLGLMLAAMSESNDYATNQYNLTNDSGMLALSAVVALLYGVVTWASVKLGAVVAGYIRLRAG